MSQAPAPRLHLCADLSKQAGEDPVGTAPQWQEVTVLELDIPVWAQLQDVESWTPEQLGVFGRLRGKVESSGAGFGMLMCAPQQAGNPLRVRHYTLRDFESGRGGYVRQDYASDLSQTEWARGLTDTLLEPVNLQHWQKLNTPSGPDFHVCTHGTVDAACGKYGSPVFAALQTGGVRAWRTGHFGGHRFAATAVELPSGLLWAHLSPELAVQVARREVPPSQVRMHLRGYAGLPKLAQVLDRELLIRYGWDWLNAQRWATVDGEHVDLAYCWHNRDNESGRWEAKVIEVDPLRVRGSSHKPDIGEFKQYQAEF